MTYDDPCDELSEGLTSLLLKDARFQRLTLEQRRHLNVNSAYGKFGNELRAYVEYNRLVKAVLKNLISNPAIVIQHKPRAFWEVYDNPISPRTWSLD